jgi:hypothetical protein
VGCGGRIGVWWHGRKFGTKGNFNMGASPHCNPQTYRAMDGWGGFVGSCTQAESQSWWVERAGRLHTTSESGDVAEARRL